MIARGLPALLVLACSMTPCLGGTYDPMIERPVVEPPPAAVAANVAAKQALAKPLGDLDFSHTTLSAVIATLRERSGANIFVNWKSLKTMRVDRNAAVSVTLHGKTLRDAIDLLLSIAGAERDSCGVAIEDGTVTISTANDLQKNVAVRVYDIRPIIGRPATPADRQHRIDALIRLVEDQIDTPSWKDRGGNVGALRELQGQLIVTQTPDNHAKVVKLLNGVTALCASPPAH